MSTRTFIATAPSFTGEIEFRFNADGVLTGYDARAELTPGQFKALFQIFPITVSGLEKLEGINLKIVEIKKEVTFDDFWARWFAGRHKDNSSKIKARNKWNRMPKGEQIKAYNHIYTYMGNIPQGTPPKYAETYLNSWLWEQ